jgi:hypothetical protein
MTFIPRYTARFSMPSSQVTIEREMWMLIALLVLFLAANLLALKAQPVFSDEPCYTDPAASFVLGRGFTSGAWYAQPDGEFFASNVPLHELALVPWLKTFGFGILQTRSINWLYSIVGILLIWDAARSAGWINSTWLRLAACGVMLFTETAYSLNQLGRPDGITFLLGAVAVRSFALPSSNWRLWILFIAGAAAAWAGLQLVAAFFLTCLTGLGIWRLRWFREMAALGCGVAAGLLGLFLFYQYHGVWNRFTDSASPNAANSARDIYAFAGFFSDRSFLLLAVCFALIFVSTFFIGGPTARKSALFGGAMLTALPLGLLAFGKFSAHYTWMPALASTLCAAALIERFRPGKLIGAAACTLALLAIAVGYPRRAGISLAFANDDIPRRTEQFTAAHITGDDHVIYAAQAYFPVKRIAAKAYYYNWYPTVMSAAEAAAVTVMIIEPRTFVEMQNKIGGEWNTVGEPLRYPVRRFPNRDTWMELAVYRRVD